MHVHGKFAVDWAQIVEEERHIEGTAGFTVWVTRLITLGCTGGVEINLQLYRAVGCRVFVSCEVKQIHSLGVQ